MKNTDINIYESDMKLKLTKEENDKITKDFEEFLKEVKEVENTNIDNVNVLVNPIYDCIITFLREDEILDEVKSSKEVVSLSKNSKDGFFSIPKVVK